MRRHRIGILRYDRVERLLNRKINSGGDIPRRASRGHVKHTVKYRQKKRADASTLFRCRPKASTAIAYILVDILCLSTGPAPKNVISIFCIHLSCCFLRSSYIATKCIHLAPGPSLYYFMKIRGRQRAVQVFQHARVVSN